MMNARLFLGQAFQLEGTTYICSIPFHSWPGFTVIGFSTAALSTATKRLQSSTPKSDTFLSHGFHTTAHCNYKSFIISTTTICYCVYVCLQNYVFTYRHQLVPPCVQQQSSFSYGPRFLVYLECLGTTCQAFFFESVCVQ